MNTDDDLAARRRQRGYALCPCGSAWWSLTDPDRPEPAVTLAPTGAVTGYTGTPTCTECGAPYTPAP